MRLFNAQTAEKNTVSIGDFALNADHITTTYYEKKGLEDIMAKIHYVPPRRKRKMNNFDFAMGLGVDWTDLDRGRVYNIKEYAQAMHDPNIPEKDKPKKIRVSNMYGGQTLEYLEPELIRERMKDPEPDPRYAAETPEEIRRNLRNDY